MKIQKLSLVNFRNHHNINISTDDKDCIIITGKNGSGKTSILEAISILYPGRGIRSAKLIDTIKWGTQKAKIRTDLTNSKSFITEIEAEIAQKKLIEINGQKIKGHKELAEMVKILWFSPQICNLLISSNVARIKFIDRIAYSFDAHHAKLIIECKKAMQTRIKLLLNNNQDRIWFRSLEKIIAHNSILIHRNRKKAIAQLSQDQRIKVGINITGGIAGLVKTDNSISAEDIENQLLEKLEKQRIIQNSNQHMPVSIYRNAIKISNLHDKRDLATCSTGEQKDLVLSIILAQSNIQIQSELKPIILLDDPMAHLSSDTRQGLIYSLDQSKCQIWIADHEREYYSTQNNKVIQI